MGARLAKAHSEFCNIVVPYSKKVTQQHGFFYGGVTATIADTAAGFASYTLMEPNQQPLTVEFKISYLAPAKGEALEARAKVVRAGYRLKHVSVEVFALDSGLENLVALVGGRF